MGPEDNSEEGGLFHQTVLDQLKRSVENEQGSTFQIRVLGLLQNENPEHYNYLIEQSKLRRFDEPSFYLKGAAIGNYLITLHNRRPFFEPKPIDLQKYMLDKEDLREEPGFFVEQFKRLAPEFADYADNLADQENMNDGQNEAFWAGIADGGFPGLENVIPLPKYAEESLKERISNVMKRFRRTP